MVTTINNSNTLPIQVNNQAIHGLKGEIKLCNPGVGQKCSHLYKGFSVCWGAWAWPLLGSANTIHHIVFLKRSYNLVNQSYTYDCNKISGKVRRR